jgi:hypothetical protein
VVRARPHRATHGVLTIERAAGDLEGRAARIAFETALGVLVRGYGMF